MDITVFIGPVATVTAVCLAAYFALRNERKKKALEIRTAQLDRISELVNRTCINLMEYAGCLASILETKSKGTYPPNYKFSIDVISSWKNEIDRHESWNLDIQQLRTCQHSLEFHRGKQWVEWKKIASPLTSEIDRFFLISVPGKPVTFIDGHSKTVSDLLDFSRHLQKRTQEIDSMRKVLLTQMREEFSELTRFEPVTIFSLFKSIKKSVMQFFCIGAIKD